MPGLSPLLSGRDALTFRRVSESQRRVALAVLLVGQPDAADKAVEPFLQFARDQQLKLDNLWGAWDGKRLLAAALLVTAPGRTGMLFISPIVSTGRAAVLAQLVAEVVRSMARQDMALVQTLIDVGQDLPAEAVVRGGFKFLAELVYMQRAGVTETGKRPPSLDGEPLTLESWSEANRADFAHVIAASYEDTLDCPGLRGLREMDDILAGHQSTGKFAAAHWTLCRNEAGGASGAASGGTSGGAVAVLLLAEAVNGSGMELVYLGLIPGARGQGLGRALMHRALDTAARYGSGHLHLAVDGANLPALKLYRSLGFKATVRKHAYIWVPPPPDTPPDTPPDAPPEAPPEAQADAQRQPREQ